MEGECPGCCCSVSCVSGLLLTHHCLLAAMEHKEETKTDNDSQSIRSVEHFFVSVCTELPDYYGLCPVCTYAAEVECLVCLHIQATFKGSLCTLQVDQVRKVACRCT